MALLAEEIVEEWLNRDGWFTIRGIKMGVDEIDILAIKPANDGIECRHLEVQASFNPVSYLTKVPKKKRLPGQAAGSARHRSDEDLRICVREWVRQKFEHPKKVKQRAALFNGKWTRELVVHNLKHPEELTLIREFGITVHSLSELIVSFRRDRTVVSKAAGADFVELVTGFRLKN
ncbi:MAG TPA: hypothetical protein VNU95_07345 [Candidatus Acidoferrales bacterium]|jgi:hypothetical protein|nr:hypothetical protein [Candidatus Acidoferrales bacterium]